MTRAMALLAALLAAASVLAVGPAHAQATPTDLLADDTGDLQVYVQGAPSGSPAGRFNAADVTSLKVVEAEESLTFVLGVASLDGSSEVPFAEQAIYHIGFTFVDQVYRVEAFRQVRPGDQGSYFAQLQLYDSGRADYGTISFGQVSPDLDAKTISVAFDRKLILDGDGNAPHPEAPLTEWNVEAIGGPSNGGCQINIDGQSKGDCIPVRVADRMPNEGNGTVPLQIKLGITQTGHARLRSATPTRSSNGEATTFVYQVEAQNTGDQDDMFRLSATGPANWQVRLPATEVKVAALDRIVFPVLVTIPFQHEHGTIKTVQVEMRSMSDDGTVGRLQLGVRFAQPPQPAGHHNVLTFHSRAPADDPLAVGLMTVAGRGGGIVYMNAEEADPLDASADIAGRTCDFNPAPPQVGYCWNVPLSPGLQLGMDFDLAGSGTLSVPIKTNLPLPGATLEGRLMRYGPAVETQQGLGQVTVERNVTILAFLEPAAPVDLAPLSSGNLLTAGLKPATESDYVPYEEGASLVLELELHGTRGDTFFGPHDTPFVQPGGALQLPLNEYHDKVDTVFAGNSTVRLVPLGEQDRMVNPGKTALFRLDLENKGAEADFHLDLAGTNAAWAILAGTPIDLHLGANEKATVQVAVRAPDDAAQGATADLVLTATQVDDLNVRTLARLYTTVDMEADHPDDSAAAAGQAETKDSPLPLTVVLAAVALAIAARRR